LAFPLFLWSNVLSLLLKVRGFGYINLKLQRGSPAKGWIDLHARAVRVADFSYCIPVADKAQVKSKESPFQSQAGEIKWQKGERREDPKVLFKGWRASFV
jgi:hypothetical protein